MNSLFKAHLNYLKATINIKTWIINVFNVQYIRINNIVIFIPICIIILARVNPIFVKCGDRYYVTHIRYISLHTGNSGI